MDTEALNQMIKDEFPAIRSNDLRKMVDRIQDLVSDATMEIVQDIMNEFRFEKGA